MTVVSMHVRKPGAEFARVAIALARAKGAPDDAVRIARHVYRDTPGVAEYIEKSVSAMDTTTGAALTVPGTTEILNIVRPRTILGRLTRLRRVPFQTGAPLLTGGVQFGWCTGGLPIPVGAFQALPSSLREATCGGIVVITRELSDSSSPDAEGVVAEELAAGMVEFLDEQFIDPDVAEVTEVSPASITHGAPAYPVTGTTGPEIANDLAQLVARLFAGLRTLDGVVLLMSDINAFALSLLTNGQGAPLFPDLGAAGGTIAGVPVVTSASLETNIVAVHAPSVLYADAGNVQVDSTGQASLQMSDSPAASAQDMVSLWQVNATGIRVRRTINWGVAREGAVQVLTGADYAPVLIES